MKKSAEFFDKSYFEKAQGGHKSNYTRVGGYRRHASEISRTTSPLPSFHELDAISWVV